MSDRYGMAAHSHPSPQPVTLMPSLVPPPQLPPGYGGLTVELNRGPFLMPAGTGAKLKISGHDVPASLVTGPWYVPVLAGRHLVKVTDPFGVPAITTEVAVHAGQYEYRRFEFGSWKNRALDASGADVTRFGMWSNYAVALTAVGATLVVCCGGLGLIVGLGVLASS